MTERTEVVAPADPHAMPQLDGLRALAVLAVVVHHYLRPAPIVGLLGVKLFFVLSGFLITGILLRARQAVEAGATTRQAVFMQFYLRRALRIFPLYYLVLAIAWLLGDADARVQIPWLATYTYNFWIAVLGWFPAYFSHFRSLAVEEQFYLLWPAAILLVPRRALVPFLACVVLAAPLYRAVAWQLSLPGLWFHVMTPAGLLGGLGWLLLLLLCGGMAGSALPETPIALVFVALVAAASAGFRGPAGRLLEAAPLRYLGRISCGVYVYHLLLPHVVAAVPGWLGVVIELRGIPCFLLFTAAAIMVASLSWLLCASPLNALKRRFPSACAPAPTQPTAGRPAA